MDLGLTGSVATVTGASAGIGAAVARSLAQEGARLCLVARRRDRLEVLADELATSNERPLVLALDLALPSSTASVRDAVLERYGQVQILINAAGGSRFLAVESTDDDWQEAFSVNFDGLRRLSHALLDTMRAQRDGCILNITGSLEPKGLNAANAAKAAVHAWAKGLSRDVGADGVRVNSISPGRILTEQIVERLHPDSGRSSCLCRGAHPAGPFRSAE